MDVAAIRRRVECEDLINQFGLRSAKLVRPDLFGLPLLLGFVHHFGHVQYSSINTRHALWTFVSEMSACELDSQNHQEGRMVFDHCHWHGWIRGMICPQHNMRLGQLEAVMRFKGVTVDLGKSAYASYLELCPGCSGAEVIARPLARVSDLQALLLG